MPIPSRPAPPPPINIINNNNSSQIHQHQLQQQPQNVGVTTKLTIKLPILPPKGSTGRVNATNNSLEATNQRNSSSILSNSIPQNNVRYEPTTNWDGGAFEPAIKERKVPPPRPPPPRKPTTPKTSSFTNAPAQSVNILTNIFGRKKSNKAQSRPMQKNITGNAQSGQQFNLGQSHVNSLYSSLSGPLSADGNVQLINFDSPPSSPTFTQKSNSDCVSVDSFSSDSNFSSPNNGSASQPESGFEDDCSASRTTISPLDPWDTFGSTNEIVCGNSNANTIVGGAAVRNYNIVTNRINQNTDNPLCNGKSLMPPAPILNKPTIIKPRISHKPRAPNPPSLDQVRYNLAIGVNQNDQSTDWDSSSTPPSPPMPNCPPPPPPPGVDILGVITGRIDAISLTPENMGEKQPYGVALYDFKSDVAGDLTFREAEKIYILEKLNDEWLRGRNRSGCEGIFPINYIDVKIPLKTESTLATPTTASEYNKTPYNTNCYKEEVKILNNNNHSTSLTTTINSTKTTAYRPKQVRCLYTFNVGEPGDLILQENDMVTVLYRINEDWLFGESLDKRQGQFPANFLEFIPENIPMP